MGKKSIERVICKIYLNVTNIFYGRLIETINNTNFKRKIEDPTFGYVKFIKKIINEKKERLSTLVELSLILDVDMYHIVRMKKGKVIANIAKIFKKKRKNQVCLEIKNEITQNLINEINKKSGIFSFASKLAITIENVIVR